jgi:hypothetical protein
MKLRRSLYARPENRPRTAVRRGAPWVVSPCRCLATAVAGLLGGVLPAELSWLLIDQRRLASGRWSLWTASQRSDVVAPAGNAGAPAMPSVANPCSPLGVHPVRFPRPGPGVQLSGVQPSGVRSAGSVVRDPAVRPSGVRPSASGRLVSARPPDHLRLVRVSPAVALEITSVRRAIFTTGTDRVACGRRCPERLGRAPSRPGGGRWGGGGEAGGGAAIADLAGSGPGRGCGHAPPLTGQGRPVRREGRRWLPAEPGMGARVQARRSWPWRGGISAQSMTTLRGRCGA